MSSGGIKRRCGPAMPQHVAVEKLSAPPKVLLIECWRGQPLHRPGEPTSGSRTAEAERVEALPSQPFFGFSQGLSRQGHLFGAANYAALEKGLSPPDDIVVDCVHSMWAST